LGGTQPLLEVFPPKRDLGQKKFPLTFPNNFFKKERLGFLINFPKKNPGPFRGEGRGETPFGRKKKNFIYFWF